MTVAPQTFQSEVNVEVILQDNETAISFMVCIKGYINSISVNYTNLLCAGSIYL